MAAIQFARVRGTAVPRQSPTATPTRSHRGHSLVVRRDSGVVMVDPVSGKSCATDLEDDVARIDYHAPADLLLLTLASGAIVIRSCQQPGNQFTVLRFRSGWSPLVVADRIIGYASESVELTIFDLATMTSLAVSESALPGDPSDWSVQTHPTRPAALIDARGMAGSVILLPSSDPRTARIVDDLIGPAIAISPDGNGIAQLVPVASDWVATRADPPDVSRMSESVPETGMAELSGPLGDSGNMLMFVEHREGHSASVLSCGRMADATERHDRVVIDGGSVDYWFASPDGTSVFFHVSVGADSTWSLWHPGNGAPTRLDLPGELEPAFASGASGRWFHGATRSASHLGSGERRFMVLDAVTGDIAADHIVDERLELAASSVSKEGSVLAHVQADNTGSELMVAYLGTPADIFQASIEREPAPVAASAIDLRIEVSAGMSTVAAAFSWDHPDHNAPWIAVVCRTALSAPVARSVVGTLLGIVPDGCSL